MATQNAASTPARRTITATSFDFLNGAYKRSAQARLAALVVIGIVITAAMMVFLYGVNHMVMASSAREEAQQAFAERLQASGELTRISASGGLSEEDMLAHLKARSETALKITKSSPSLGSLLTDLQNNAPSGTTVRSVILGSAAQTAESASSSTSAEGGTTPTSITITAAAEDYGVIKAWEESLTRLPYIQSSFKTNWSGAQDGAILLTTTAQLDTSVSSARYQSLLGELDTARSTGGQQ